MTKCCDRETEEYSTASSFDPFGISGRLKFQKKFSTYKAQNSIYRQQRPKANSIPEPFSDMLRSISETHVSGVGVPLQRFSGRNGSNLQEQALTPQNQKSWRISLTTLKTPDPDRQKPKACIDLHFTPRSNFALVRLSIPIERGHRVSTEMMENENVNQKKTNELGVHEHDRAFRHDASDCLSPGSGNRGQNPCPSHLFKITRTTPDAYDRLPLAFHSARRGLKQRIAREESPAIRIRTC